MVAVFLCYRATDEAYAAALVDDHLSRAFGRDQVFRASRSIRPGHNYPLEIMAALKQCEFVLVFIGPNWISYLEADGTRRIDNEDDWVRREILFSLQEGKRIIPVLLANTPRLREKDLPADLAELANIQSIPFHYRDVERAIADIVDLITTETSTGSSPPPEA